MARGGGIRTVNGLPVARSATRSTLGASHGTAMSPTAVTITIAAATAGALAYGSASRRQPVTITTRNPAAMFTAVPNRAEPVAATGDTPARCASTPIAAICQTLPGT